MSDTYQAVYDAVCSKIGRANSHDAISEAARQAFDISFAVAQVKEELIAAAHDHCRPCVLFRPAIMIDGNKWVALYGANIQDGVAGSGDSPDEAMRDFDAHWLARLPVQRAATASPDSHETP